MVLLKLLAVMVLVAAARDTFGRGCLLAQARGEVPGWVSLVVGALFVAALVWAVWFLGGHV